MQFPIEQFTAKQQKFILAYCRLQHQTNAAIEAGVNPRSAAMMASKWMSNDKIKGEIDRRLRDRVDRYEVRPDKIIKEMALLAFSSLDDFIAFTESNQAVIDFTDVTRDQMASLTEIVSEEFSTGRGAGAARGVRTKIRLADKRAALMDLAKLINMLKPDQVEHSGTIAHEHKHAHVVLNPRDMSPRQRAELKRVLLSIEGGRDDAEDVQDGDDHHPAGAEPEPE